MTLPPTPVPDNTAPTPVPDSSVPTPVPMLLCPIVIAPATGEEVADALRDASAQRHSLVIRGAGTKSDWGRSAARVDTVLDMRRLNRVLAHQHGDLTATIEAGAALRDVNHALAQRGQWLPLDPPFAAQATIGGILATNDSGPLRHRYGTPRDLVIGIRLATTDGVLAKAGGQVVKNVAGYDLSKLVTGSFGCLAAIVSATFKLAPLPRASKTLRLEAPDAAALGQMVRTVMASQLEPIAFELDIQRSTQRPQSGQRAAFSTDSASSGFNVVLRFGSLPAVVDAQIDAASAALTGLATSVRIIDADNEQRLWSEHSQRLWNADGAIVRASWLPANVTTALAGLEQITAAPKGGDATGGIDLIGRAAVGAGLIRIEGDATAQAHMIQQLRASSSFGNVVVVRGSAELKALVDVWGPHGDRQPVFDSLKRALDPTGVLNAGRGPL
jgi:glycolate oxidase FAD binding subunit